MTLYVPAKEFEGELWVRVADFQKAVSEAEGRSIAEAEQQEPVGVVGTDIGGTHLMYGSQYVGKTPDKKTAIFFKDVPIGSPLYTSPPKREQQEPVYHLRQFGDVTKEQLDRYIATGDINPQPEEHKQAEGAAWQGLTDDEIDECFKITPDQYLPAQIYKRIEAKLKEKNT